jgi:hypothetical protein
MHNYLRYCKNKYRLSIDPEELEYHADYSEPSRPTHVYSFGDNEPYTRKDPNLIYEAHENNDINNELLNLFNKHVEIHRPFNLYHATYLSNSPILHFHKPKLIIKNNDLLDENLKNSHTKYLHPINTISAKSKINIPHNNILDSLEKYIPEVMSHWLATSIINLSLQAEKK